MTLDCAGLETRRLWSLWDMLELNAGAFFEAVATIQHAITFVSTHPHIEQGAKPMRPHPRSHFTEVLTKLRTLLLVLNARLTLLETDRTLANIIENEKYTPNELADSLHSISSRLQDELSLVNLYSVGENYIKYITDASLFGQSVEMKIPEMSEDIAEAGKCLAFERPTAAVFHLMRVMEIGVQRFGDKLGIKLVHELNWQVILDQINKAIKVKNHKLSETKAMSEAAAHLYAVKVAWRNEVMHPKQTYTSDQAETIFGNTRTFVRELAAIL